MSESHASLDKYYQVSCDELNTARETMRKVCYDLDEKCDRKEPPVIGARMTGGGFGGSTI